MACHGILYEVASYKFSKVEEVVFCCFDVVLGMLKHFIYWDIPNKVIVKKNQTKSQSKYINKNAMPILVTAARNTKQR
jgi:hypothetical protein